MLKSGVLKASVSEFGEIQIIANHIKKHKMEQDKDQFWTQKF